jgi:hypothetical protein
LAIRTGIDPGAVLWKFTTTRQRQVYNRERNEYEYQDFTEYFAIKLVTRRARTQGYVVEKAVQPFFESLRIKLTPTRAWRDNRETTMYVAVGTECTRIRNEEEWNNLEIDEEAQRWYTRIKNNDLTDLLEARSEQFSNEIIEEMRSVIEESTEEESEWPPEPHLREHSMVMSSYYHPRNW